MHDLYAPVSKLIHQVSADVIVPRFGNLAAEDISEKAANDFVTVADKESELRLAEGLAAILPEAGIVGEEAAAADLSLLESAGKGLQWIIDPIDGTGNFAAGHPPFGVMIALVENGVVLAGWLFDPLTARMCYAALGGGAWIGQEAIVARESGSPKPIAALATSFMTLDKREEIEALAENHFKVVDIPRCAAEQYPRLALGQNDIAIFERSFPWDHAPGALFLNEAGGKLSRQDGSDYIIGDRKSGLLGAASPRLWDEAARILFA